MKIKLTKEQIKLMSKAAINGEGIEFDFDPEPEKYELSDTGFSLIGNGTYDKTKLGSYLETGASRSTEEQIKRASKRMVRANRLSALACELDGEIEFDSSEPSYFIYKNKSSTYEYDSTYDFFYPESVYMKENCAKKICEMLNNGEFEL